MSEHRVTVIWECTDPGFLQGRYSRAHTWKFDGGMTIPASPSPAIVPIPYANPAFVDPEEAFVAAISSCHLLTFLYLASQHGFQCDRYEDEAVGYMSRNEQGAFWISTVQLHPHISYSGATLPSEAEIAHLHHLAHAQCFIANSVKTVVTVAT